MKIEAREVNDFQNEFFNSRGTIEKKKFKNENIFF